MREPEAGGKPPLWRRVPWRAPLGVVVVIAAAWWVLPMIDPAAIADWKREAHPLVFFPLMAVLSSAGFPTTPFYLAAGAAFGARVGLIGTWAALAAHLVICYWVARSGLRPLLLRGFVRMGWKPPELRGGEGWAFAMMVRLAPGPPSFVKNYLLASSGVPAVVYFTVSFLVAGAYASALVVLGESFIEGRGGRAAGALAALVFLVAAAAWVGKRRKRRSRQAEEAGSDPAA